VSSSSLTDRSREIQNEYHAIKIAGILIFAAKLLLKLIESQFFFELWSEAWMKLCLAINPKWVGSKQNLKSPKSALNYCTNLSGKKGKMVIHFPPVVPTYYCAFPSLLSTQSESFFSTYTRHLLIVVFSSCQHFINYKSWWSLNVPFYSNMCKCWVSFLLDSCFIKVGKI